MMLFDEDVIELLYILGKGELYMWGKNAGLILAEKAAHYFQYIPHHVMMNDLFVIKVS